ncbi:hypothetical protein [Bifidobacterium moukalabense]|uniref:hypothetical protein n=1 Tax=Bifidobacterium moukalabense TaxID=1333651 RepID=UPI0010F56372|nr:hypothetical protein [Bifidobacterium moukalabense]
MKYTSDDFQDWLIPIDFKMEYFTNEFAEEQKLTLDYSRRSLDELENWILTNFDDHKKPIADSELSDYMTIYAGETFRRYIGGKWFIDLKNKRNAYYSMPVLTDPSYRGEAYKAPMTFVTACISRKKGNYISGILNNCIKTQNL